MSRVALPREGAHMRNLLLVRTITCGGKLLANAWM
jgi:hypothetical protein